MGCVVCGRSGREHWVNLVKLNKGPVDFSGPMPVINGHDLMSVLVVACERPECVRKAGQLEAASVGDAWEVDDG